MNISYVNKKDKEIKLRITYHAKTRFKERYNKIFIDNQLDDMDSVDTAIEKWWKLAVPKTSKTRKLQTRRKRHGIDSLYFISSYFLFVVQNSTIVTIELGSRDTRHLNKKPLYIPSTKERSEKTME